MSRAMKTNCVLIMLLVLAGSCSVSKNYSPAKKYGPGQLQEDYRLFRNILEESHPSLYWYTPKDTIDHYFDKVAAQLNDSLPEYKFRNLLSMVLSQVR